MATLSERQRFVADHSSAETLAGFLTAAGPMADQTSLAAAAQNQGYRLSESEVADAIKEAEQVLRELGDEELDQVVGAYYPVKNLRSPFE